MFKTLMVSATLLAGTSTLALADVGGLQTGRSASQGYTDHHPMHHYRVLHGHRNRGVSYGTGYRGRGTATGGPVGGLPGKN